MPRQSVMRHQFGSTPRAMIPRSSFDRSHGLKTTFDADELVPILVDDIMPGDTFNVSVNLFARLATPIYPIMDNLYLETFFFFVPYRLVWDNWEKFCGAQDDPNDSIDFTIPIRDTGNTTIGGLYDYMGLPHGVGVGEHNVLPFRAYNLIFNEWFRSQSLTDSATVNTDDGPDTTTFNIQKRAKRYDYFTAALPSPQKGTAVSLPLGTSAPIYADAGVNNQTVGILGTVTDTVVRALDTDGTAGGDLTLDTGTIATHQLLADLSGATAATINDLRLAFKTQRLLERDARSGTRYNETILAHWGVVVPDFRVQRPEFLGGGTSPLNVTPVAQTTYQGTATAEDAKGALAGFGTVSGRHSFTKSFNEHGVLLGLINARADITYSQGKERYWSKSTRYDFMYPILADIGEQAITNGEIYWQDTPATDDAVWGYIPRYDEYRHKLSRITGAFRHSASGTLNSWHLSEEFSSLPTLGNTFIESNTAAPLDNAIAVSTEPHFIADIFFQMRCARPMPLYGEPGGLGRF